MSTKEAVTQTSILQLTNERSRNLFVIAIAMTLGTFMMPHDMSVATIVDKFIYPSVIAGICFGISIMAGVALWKDEKNKASSKP